MLVKTKARKKVRPVLHGHTTIELRNVNTGVRERIEHDNEFTGALEEAVKTNGMWQQSPWANTTWASAPIYQRLLGGVYLFHNRIEKVNGEYPHFMPASNSMVANGSFGVGNATAVTEMGTYSTNDSYFHENAISLVYDWTTAQANGASFQCVCLGSDVGGYIGYGNGYSNVAHPTLKKVDENQSPAQIALTVTYNNQGYQAPNNYGFTGSTVVLNRSMGFYDKVVSVFGCDSDTFEIQVPTDKIPADTYKYVRGVRDGLLVFYPTSTATGEKMKIGYYDMSKHNSDDPNVSPWTWHDSLYNPLSSQLSWNNASSDFDEDGFSYAYSNQKFIVVFGENEDVAITNFPQTLTTSKNMFEFAPKLWMTDGWIYNSEKAQFIPCNGEKLSTTNMKGANMDGDNILMKWTSGNIPYLKRFHNPWYLATVNNLDTPITKSSSVAMKLTYTITKVAEQEEGGDE